MSPLVALSRVLTLKISLPLHSRQIEGVPRLENGLPDYKAVNEHLSYMAGGGACTIPRFTA